MWIMNLKSLRFLPAAAILERAWLRCTYKSTSRATAGRQSVAFSPRSKSVISYSIDMAALVFESVGGSAGQQQTELRCWADDDTPELISGHMMMVTTMGAGSRHHRLSVFARLYRACSGRILVLWPDKVHSLPLGCINLRDTSVSRHCSEDIAFVLRHQSADGGGIPLTLACLSLDDYKRWEMALLTQSAAVDPSSSRRKLFTSSNVTRLPMLIEEEPWINWKGYAAQQDLFLLHFNTFTRRTLSINCIVLFDIQFLFNYFIIIITSPRIFNCSIFLIVCCVFTFKERLLENTVHFFVSFALSRLYRVAVVIVVAVC